MCWMGVNRAPGRPWPRAARSVPRAPSRARVPPHAPLAHCDEKDSVFKFSQTTGILSIILLKLLLFGLFSKVTAESRLPPEKAADPRTAVEGGVVRVRFAPARGCALRCLSLPAPPPVLSLLPVPPGRGPRGKAALQPDSRVLENKRVHTSAVARCCLAVESWSLLCRYVL